MKNYLITGIAGTGKSAVGKALSNKGFRLLETDRNPDREIEHRSPFDARTGEASNYQRGDGWDELQHVRWNIVPEILYPDLKGPDDQIQFVCGYANNWDEFKDNFDGIFLLEASPSTITNRLLTRTAGDWGRKHPEELKHAIETAQDFNDSIRQLGAVVIDAEKPIDDIVSEIVERVQ